MPFHFEIVGIEHAKRAYLVTLRIQTFCALFFKQF